MKSANVLLLIIDPDAVDHPAIARGVELARHFDATLELYICDVVTGVPEQWAGALSTHQYATALREQRLQHLEQLAQPLRDQGLQVITSSDSCASLEQGVLRHVVATKPISVIDDELHNMRKRMRWSSGTSIDALG